MQARNTRNMLLDTRNGRPRPARGERVFERRSASERGWGPASRKKCSRPAALIAALLVTTMAGIGQAQPPEPPAPSQVEQPSTPPSPQGPPEIQAEPDINPRIRIQRDRRGILRMSQDYLLNETDRVDNVVVNN